MMKMNSSNKIRRTIYRILQFIAVSCVFIIPFIKTSNGNSLFRFDVGTLQLHFFNKIIAFSSFFNAFIAILLIVFLFILVTQLLGRVWCGWLCPQSFFSIRLEKYVKKIRNKSAKRIAEIFLAAIFSFLLTTVWVMYFISPYDFIDVLYGSGGRVMFIIWLSVFIFLFLDFALVRFKWCKYICPYSKFQVVMTDSDTLYVGMIPGKDNECLKCFACVRSCPTKIDPRKTPDADCIYCETCVSACDKVFANKNRAGILGYVWGDSNKFNLKRPNLIVTFLISLILTILLIYNMLNSDPLIIDFVSDMKNIGENVYQIETVIYNNTDKPVRVNIKSSPDDAAEITPENIRIFIRGSERVTLTVKLNNNEIGNFLKLESYYSLKAPPVISEILINRSDMR